MGDGEETNAHQHPAGRPNIREQVLGIGLERDRAKPATCAAERRRDEQVDHAGDDGDEESQADLFHRLRIHQALDSDIGDAPRGDDDKRTFEPTGEVFGLRVTVGVDLVGGAGGDRGAQMPPAAATRLTADSAASEKRPTERVRAKAPNLSAMVISAAPSDSHMYDRAERPFCRIAIAHPACRNVVRKCGEKWSTQRTLA